MRSPIKKTIILVKIFDFRFANDEFVMIRGSKIAGDGPSFSTECLKPETRVNHESKIVTSSPH